MRPTHALGWIAALALLGWVTFLWSGGAYGNPRFHSKASVCLSNLKQQTTAFLIYADDYDDRLPKAVHWMDATDSYLKNDTLRHCPSVQKEACGYAFNAGLSGLKQSAVAAPTLVPIVYDSTNPTRNASDPLLSLPNPGRHEDKDSVAYVDGHAKAVSVP